VLSTDYTVPYCFDMPLECTELWSSWISVLLDMHIIWCHSQIVVENHANRMSSC